MAGIEVRRFDAPDERRPFQGHGHLDLVRINGRELGLGTFEPGWRWSQDVKPIAQTESCEFAHFGYSTVVRAGRDGKGAERVCVPGPQPMVLTTA